MNNPLLGTPVFPENSTPACFGCSWQQFAIELKKKKKCCKAWKEKKRCKKCPANG
ncbi:MAG: hypothetical protein MUC87_16435 [Bacteroidia bacterium]|nr:hypothetical protein [Bacteroidia bacterium]